MRFEVLTAVSTVDILRRVFMSVCTEVSEKYFLSTIMVDEQVARDRTC